jgi:hypothetical protein
MLSRSVTDRFHLYLDIRRSARLAAAIQAAPPPAIPPLFPAPGHIVPAVPALPSTCNELWVIAPSAVFLSGSNHSSV